MPGPFKRLVALSDGSWQDPEAKTPTNILKLAMSLQHETADGTQQVVLYDAGVGTLGGLDKLSGGAFGAGIDRNILDLYTALALNHAAGDEVYLFGFSRGAYTVRSLAGLINTAGLVRREEIQWAHEAYELYRSAPGADSDVARAFRAKHGERVSITCLACFDTVGSLGLPSSIGALGALDDHRYCFHDTTLSKGVQNAIHALSVDESRSVFAPTRMEAHPERGVGQLTQVFFAGGHGGVGGGDSVEWPLSDYVLRWVLDEMERRGLGLEVREEMVGAGNVNVPPKEGGGDLLFKIIGHVTGEHVREIKFEECHPSVALRYAAYPQWRPKSLEPIRERLLEFGEEELRRGGGFELQASAQIVLEESEGGSGGMGGVSVRERVRLSAREALRWGVHACEAL